MLTRIAYHALGLIQYLPAPLEDTPDIPFLPRPYVPAKKGSKRKQEAEGSAQSTHSKKKTKTEPESEDSQQDQDHPSHSEDEEMRDQGEGGGDDQFNIEDLLSGTPERPQQQQRDDFGDIADYKKALAAEIEAARLTSILQHKEDEKLRKAKERMKTTGEGSSHDPPVASRQPLPIPQQQQQTETVIPEVPLKEHRPGKEL